MKLIVLMTRPKTPSHKNFCLKGDSENHGKAWSFRPVFGSVAENQSSYFCDRPVKAPLIWSQSVSSICIECGGLWKGNILVADIGELENLDASEIYARRLNAKEVLSPKGVNFFKFPIADGTAKLFGRDDEFREPTPRQEQLAGSEDLRGELQGKSERSPPKETKDDAEARNHLRSMEGDFIYRHHVEPRVQLFVAEEQTFRIPLKYIDVTRTGCVARNTY